MHTAPATAGSATSLCVVDDDVSACRGVVRLLNSAGFRVTSFSSAQEFLDWPDRDPFSCLILDLRMPGISGLELQEKLAAENLPPPIIFLTAHDDDEARSQALERGAVAYLLKPVDEKLLLSAIAQVLEHNRPPEGRSEHP